MKSISPAKEFLVQYLYRSLPYPCPDQGYCSLKKVQGTFFHHVTLPGRTKQCRKVQVFILVQTKLLTLKEEGLVPCLVFLLWDKLHQFNQFLTPGRVKKLLLPIPSLDWGQPNLGKAQGIRERERLQTEHMYASACGKISGNVNLGTFKCCNIQWYFSSPTIAGSPVSKRTKVEITIENNFIHGQLVQHTGEICKGIHKSKTLQKTYIFYMCTVWSIQSQG